MVYLRAAFAFLVLTFVSANLQSPCPQIFQYSTEKKEAGKWDGILNFDSEFGLSGMWIRVFLDKKVESLTHEHAETKTDDHKSWLIRMPNSTLTPGTPVKVPFTVKFNEKDGEPNLINVRLNARDVCVGKKEPVIVSPCPGVFKFTFPNKDEEGKWYGELSLDSEFPLNGIWIRVTLDKKGEILENGFGKVEPRDVNSYLIFKKDEVLTPGHTLKVPFVVKYEDPKQIPNISQVRLNARKVCENNLIPSTIPVTHDDVNGHAASKPVTEVKENVQEHKENVHNAPRH